MAKLIPILTMAAFLAAPSAQAQKDRELKEVVRDVGVLVDDMRELKKTVEELRSMLQGLVDQSNRNNTAIAKTEAGLRERMTSMEKRVADPVTNLSTKIDSMSQDFGGVRDSLADVSARIGNLQREVTDLGNAVKVMQAPPAPPGAGGPAVPAQGVSAASLYSDAMRDRSAGNYDLAAQEFNDFLRYFGTSDDAPLAQYYLGEVYYSQKKFDEASKAFDLVLEKYPRNAKTLDAMFMKGRSLVNLGMRDAGSKEYRELIRLAPNSEQANKARSELKNLGLSTSTAPPPARKKK